MLGSGWGLRYGTVMVFKRGHKKITENLGEGPRFVVLKSTRILPYKDQECYTLDFLGFNSNKSTN